MLTWASWQVMVIAAGTGLLTGICVALLWLDDVLGWAWRRLRGGRRPACRHAAGPPPPEPGLDGWQLMTLSALQQDRAHWPEQARVCGGVLAALVREGGRGRISDKDLARVLLINLDYLDQQDFTGCGTREITGCAIVALAGGKLR